MQTSVPQHPLRGETIHAAISETLLKILLQPLAPLLLSLSDSDCFFFLPLVFPPGD